MTKTKNHDILYGNKKCLLRAGKQSAGDGEKHNAEKQCVIALLYFRTERRFLAMENLNPCPYCGGKAILKTMEVLL